MSFQARLPHMPDSSFHLARFLPHIPERLFQLLEPPPAAFGRRRLPAKGRIKMKIILVSFRFFYVILKADFGVEILLIGVFDWGAAL